jgi:hypothetical protein
MCRIKCSKGVVELVGQARVQRRRSGELIARPLVGEVTLVLLMELLAATQRP